MTREMHKEFMSRFRVECKAKIDRIEYLNRTKFCMDDIDLAEITCYRAFLDKATQIFYGETLTTMEQRKAFLEMMRGE